MNKPLLCAECLWQKFGAFSWTLTSNVCTFNHCMDFTDVTYWTACHSLHLNLVSYSLEKKIYRPAQ